MLERLLTQSLDQVEVGSPAWFEAQRQLFKSRPLLRWCYDQWYGRLLADARSVPGDGMLLELGSGASYLKELEPGIVTSDVVPGVADHVIDARRLPFPDRSIRALFLTHVFHHIPDANAFFREAERTLVPGGVISMVEVAHTRFAKFFFSNFHPEPYDDKRPEWAFPQSDSMVDSNQALSWMVFVRDRREFDRLHPGLKIEAVSWLPWFTYLLTGGATRPCLVPAVLERPARLGERLLSPLSPLFSLHWHIRVRKEFPSR